MCRLFGVLSSVEVPLSAYALEAPHSLAKLAQARDNELQSDGWGVGFYENGQPRVIKSPGSLAEDREEARKRLEGISSRIVLGHIRRASNPRGLPREALIGLEHTQPFQYGPHLFVHNGTLTIPDAVQKELGSYGARVKGKNDSEGLFWLVVKLIEEGKSIPKAFERMLDVIQTIYDKLPKTERPARAHSGLNIVYSNGKELYGFCHYPKDDTHKSLAHPDRPYFTMAAHAGADRVILASEPLFPGDWKDLSLGELVEARVDPKPNLRRAAVYGD